MTRIRYWTDVTGETFGLHTEGIESLILAEARITYRAQAFYGDTVTIQTRATRIGRSSFTLEHRLTATSRCGPPWPSAVSESVLVRFDYEIDRPVPLSDDLVAKLEAYEGRSLRAA